MALQQMSVLFTLMVLASVITHAPAVTADSGGITLDVSHNSKPGAQAGFLVINCSLDPSTTSLDTVASLSVFGSKPYGGEGEFDQLAAVDMWSTTPKMASELEESNVLVTGETGPGRSSSLVLTWNSKTNLYRHSYTCVANGIDREGQAGSVSTTVKLEVVSGGCCQNKDSLSSELQTLSAKIEVSANTSSKTSKQLSFLSQQVNRLEAKVDAIYSSTRVHSTLLAVDLTKFDVSDLFEGRLYLASKKEAVFNLQSANSACASAGGYLLEIDDEQENRFTFDFAKKIGGSDHFALGGNDIQKEGKFVYFNSKKPVPEKVTWWDGQPDNYGGKEDCMEIWLSKGGLNDRPCNRKSKFVCEVPLRF